MDNSIHIVFIIILIIICCALGYGICFIIQRHYASKRSRKVHQYIRNKVIIAQEEERKRIARDLHDSVGQALYSVIVGLQIVNQLKMETSMRDHLLEVEKLAAKAIEEVKGIAFELHPSSLDDLGLVPAIRSYIERFTHTIGIETKLVHEGSMQRYHSTIETALYRVMQEALTNAAKYSKTRKVDLYLSMKENEIMMKITDYGIGFNLDKQLGKGIGLHSMIERIELIHGRADIQSIVGQGTTISVFVPIKSRLKS